MAGVGVKAKYNEQEKNRKANKGADEVFPEGIGP